MNTFDTHIADHILMLIFGVLMPLRSVFSTRKALQELEFTGEQKIKLYWSNSLGLWLMAIAVMTVWWWSGRPFAALGLTPNLPIIKGWAFWLSLLFVTLYLLDHFMDVYYQPRREKIEEKLEGELSFLPFNRKEYLHFVVLALSAGICEEIVFRGYFIAYFSSLFAIYNSGVFLAILFPAIIFGVIHYYQGWKAVLKIVVMAILFGLIYYFNGALWWLILYHFLVDLVGGSIALNRQYVALE